jgi:hypothetical protein
MNHGRVGSRWMSLGNSERLMVSSWLPRREGGVAGWMGCCYVMWSHAQESSITEQIVPLARKVRQDSGVSGPEIPP